MRMWISKEIKKHRNDIFRLFQILSPELRIKLPSTIAQDMEQYFGAVAAEPGLSLKPFGLAGLGVPDVVNTLRQIYGLPEETAGEG